VSKEYVERLRLAYEAFHDGGVEAIVDGVAPDFEIRDRESAPDRSTLVGGQGIMELVRLNMEVFDELHLDPIEFIDSGDIVIVVVRMRVHGRASGISIASEPAHAWQFVGGRAARMEIYANRQRAVDALGLLG
jgi:ketosteroid isomerase-like protein